MWKAISHTGVKNMAKKDLTGMRFGKLVVIDHSHHDPKTRGHVWNCLCDCGKTTKLLTATLQRKFRPTRSCGCLQLEKTRGKPAHNRLPKGKSNERSLFYIYKKAARERNIEFNIDFDLFSKLTQMNCTYCDSTPKGIISKAETNGEFRYNGLDRVDNNIPYTNENVVPCCKTCNYAKRKLSVDEFKEWIKNVYNFYIKGET
jgi:hypothetical protein